MRSCKFAVAFLALSAVSSTPLGSALAAGQQDWNDCQAKDPARAIPGCTTIIRDVGESPQNRADAYVYRAGAYLTKGNTDRAIADYGEAIKLTPRNVVAYLSRALAEFRNGDKNSAIIDYNTANNFDPDAVARIASENSNVKQIADEASPNATGGNSVPPTNASDATYQALNLFGNVFERIRTNYIVRPNDWKLVDDAIMGMIKATNVSTSAVDKTKLCGEQLERQATYGALNCFGIVFEQIHKSSPVAIDDMKLIESALGAMTAGMDARSSYINAKDFRDQQLQSSSQIGGIGVEIALQYGRIEVVSPIGNSSAAKAGLQAGDFITEIDGQSIQGMTLEGATSRLRGPLGSKVHLRIVRKDRPIELTIPRELVIARPINAQAIRDVGYVRITQFNEQTTSDLKKAIGDLTSQIASDRIKGFVIDLRNNPGGLLDQAISVADAFLEQGEIVITRGREGTQRFNARPGDVAMGQPLIVLINGGSASASEIVAGALQDHRRATLIGTKSFGLGTVQTIIPLGAGNGALRLTTARYYTPAGHWLEGTGIAPDIKVVQDVPEGATANPDSYIPADQKNDRALQMAVDLLWGTAHDASFPPDPKKPQ